MKKDIKKYKIGIYIRFGNRVYTSPEEIEQERNNQIAMSRMTPEQIEFCENMKKIRKQKMCFDEIKLQSKTRQLPEWRLFSFLGRRTHYEYQFNT